MGREQAGDQPSQAQAGPARRTLFDGRPVVSFPTPRNTEMRFISTGQIGAKFYSVVWTERGDAVRLISFRRARDGEEREYRARFG